METPRNDYGSAISIDAEAIGRPGERRFRLIVRSSNGAAAMWLEKEQMSAIGGGLQRENERLDREEPSTDPDVEPLPFSASFDLEFRAGQIALGYDPNEHEFAIQAYDVESDDASRP